MTLDEAVKRALERNLDIAVERLNPQTFDWTLASLPRSYQPTFNSNIGIRSQSQFPRSQTAGADMLVTETFTGNNGITQNVKWGGGSFAVAFNNNRQEQSDLFATRNPAINANLTAVYVQPLLRNFRIDGTRAALRITALNQEMSETALRATIVRTVANTRNAYWDLRLRDSGARSRRPVAGAGHQARRGQPGARRSGDARPARCRPGAGRAGHPTPGGRHGSDDRSHR